MSNTHTNNMSVKAIASKPVIYIRCNQCVGGGKIETFSADDMLKARCMICQTTQQFTIQGGAFCP